MLLNLNTFLSPPGCSQIPLSSRSFATKTFNESNVKEKLDLKTMRDYLDFYCRMDVLQLADIMEYQRDRLMCTHGLDILHSFTLPGFSWRAALKFTGQELELISDRGMYDFIRKAKRGGISTITHRYAKTPKEIMEELLTRKERRFLERKRNARGHEGASRLNQARGTVLRGNGM